MPYSASTFLDQDAGKTVYDIVFSGPAPGYLDSAHIILYRDLIEQTGGFTFNTATNVTLDTVTEAGEDIMFRRETPKELPLVDFELDAVLTDTDLDTATLQNLYVTHEVLDGFLELGVSGFVDAGNRRVINVADAEEDADAPNYLQMTTAIAVALGQAGDDATAAAASAAAALVSENSAAGSASDAADEVVLAAAQVTLAHDEVVLAAAASSAAASSASDASDSAAAALASEVATALLGRTLRRQTLGDVAVDTDLDVSLYDYFVFKATADITIDFINVAIDRMCIIETTAGSAITWHVNGTETIKWDLDTPPTINAAAALIITISRLGPSSPFKIFKVISALTLASPPLISFSSYRCNPKSSGLI